MDKVLALLTKDARMSAADIAQRLDMGEAEVTAKIAEYEENGSILGYRALLDPEKCQDVPVRALIEVRVMPYKGHGFERVARHIAQFPEVRSISLMSGGFDLCAEVEGASMHEVALFVAEKLAVIDGVMGTATHFVLRRYKYEGIHCGQEEKDKRGFTL
jgi:DNA-binding Lrp family transcriptional regulator